MNDRRQKIFVHGPRLLRYIPVGQTAIESERDAEQTNDAKSKLELASDGNIANCRHSGSSFLDGTNPVGRQLPTPPGMVIRVVPDTLGYRHEEKKRDRAAAILTESGTAAAGMHERERAAVSITSVIFEF